MANLEHDEISQGVGVVYLVARPNMIEMIVDEAGSSTNKEEGQHRKVRTSPCFLKWFSTAHDTGRHGLPVASHLCVDVTFGRSRGSIDLNPEPNNTLNLLGGSFTLREESCSGTPA